MDSFSNIIIITSQKSLFSNTFLCDQVCFWLQKNEGNSENKNDCGVLTLFFSIIQVIFLLQDNAIFFRSESLKE